MKILITSGGTKVPIDEVRHIGNMSSGTFASKIATQALIDRDHVCFLTSSEGKTPMKITANLSSLSNDFVVLKFIEDMFIARSIKERYEEVPYKNFDEYAHWLEHYVKNGKFDAIILAAAVSDYLVEPVKGKIRSSSQLNIELKPAPKLISKIREWGFKGVLVGFKLLVDATKDELIVAANTSVIDVQNLPKGIYILTLQSNSKTYTSRFMKE